MTSSLYRSFKRALAYIATQLAPADDEVLDFVALRSAVLAELGLPASRHNIDRLMMCGIAGLSLDRFLVGSLVAPRARHRSVAGATRRMTAIAGTPRPCAILQAVEVAVPQGVAGNCLENHPPVSASRSAVNASMRS